MMPDAQVFPVADVKGNALDRHSFSPYSSTFGTGNAKPAAPITAKWLFYNKLALFRHFLEGLDLTPLGHANALRGQAR